MASSEEEWADFGGATADSVDAHDALSAHGSHHRGSVEEPGRDEHDAVGSGDERALSPEKSPSNRTDANGNSRKRGRRASPSHDDDDFESQPTITKWFRQVPGPLQDVMKQQHAGLQHSMDDDGGFASGRSSGHIVHISTVFDHGPWVDMCGCLGLVTSPGELYGGVKISSLQHTIAHIQEEDQSTPKIPRLLVLIKSMRYIDEEIFAVFHDPTGEIDGYFHRDIVEQVGPALVNGTAVLLRQVSVFTPSDAAVGGYSKRYLNIIPRNVESIFVTETVAKTMESLVRTFNSDQMDLIQAEALAEEEALDEESLASELPRVIAPADVRTATTELSFISQHQVVLRHQPVRVDPNLVYENPGDGSRKAKQKKKYSKETSSTGLGRWQWQQLAQKKPTADSEDADEARAPVRRLGPSGRFTELLSQHIQARRSAASSVVQSAPTSNEAASGSLDEPRKQSTGAKAVQFSAIPETNGDDFDDDDDDW